MKISQGRWDDNLFARIRSWLKSELFTREEALPAPVDDLIGEVMLRLLVMSKTGHIEKPFAYARMILLNLIRDYIRELERTRKFLEEVGERWLNEHCTTRGDGAGTLEDAELVEHLLKNAALSPLQDKVVRMRFLEDMTNGEIAEQLGKNPGTVRKHLDRALQKLARAAHQPRVLQ